MTSKIYKKVGNEVYMIPIFDPPAHQFKEIEKPAIPHSGELIDEEGLKHYQQLKEKIWKI